MKPIEVVTGNCHFHIKRVISSTDVIQLTLTLNMTSEKVVKKSVTVIKSPNFRTTFTRTIILDLLMKLMTPGLRPFTVLRSLGRRSERLANDYVSYAHTAYNNSGSTTAAKISALFREDFEFKSPLNTQEAS